jgi:hypothetical protein
MFKKVLVVLALSVSSLMAYSYTCFPPMTEKGSFAVNPAFFMDDNNSGGMETFLYYGLTEKMDFCSSILTVNGSSNFSVMYRYAFDDLNLGIRMNSSWVTPQLNYNWEDDLFILQASIASQFTYDYSDKPAIYGVLCPGYKFSDNLNICCDINPGYYLQDGDFANLWVRSKGFGLDIAPSIGFGVGNCLFSVALPIYDMTNELTVTFGAWLYYSIKAK